jgi:hypothetical protein
VLQLARGYDEPHGVVVGPQELARQIESQHNPSRNILTLFNFLPDLIMNEDDSINTLLRAVIRSDAPQKDECELLAVLLDQGLDINWTLPNPDPRRRLTPSADMEV